MPFLVASWYRPPDSSVDKFDLFDGLVGRMDAEGLEYYILGDMNVNSNSPNSVLFCNDISSQDWNSISQLNDPNTMWHVWNNMFLNVADKHAPINYMAKENYYKKAFDECVGDPNKTWGVINELTSRKSKSSFVKEIKLEDVTVTDSPGLANAFNNHFVTIGPKLAEKIPSNIDNCSPLHYLSGHLMILNRFN